MVIKLIHGFLHEKQKATPSWGNIEISETVLIETDDANVDILELLGAMPAAPNTVTSWNPKGISFTFDVSLHPDNINFVLRSAGDVAQDPETAVFWTVELKYSIFYSGLPIYAPEAGSNKNPKSRKDQREQLVPTDRPVVWNSSTSFVEKERYMVADGTAPILHTNGLPLTTPYRYPSVHTTHTFSYNIDYDDYDSANFEPYVGTIDKTHTILGRPSSTMKFSNFTTSEEYESIGDSLVKTEYHFIRVTLSFEYNPDGWEEDARLISMSTVQKITFALTTFYSQIKISATEYAQEPWPLKEDGTAIDYNNNDPTLYGEVFHGYPLSSDLRKVTGAVTVSGSGIKVLTIP